MTPTAHLTEEERHAYADDSLPADRRRELATHLARCAECAADVRRIEAAVKAMRAAPTPSMGADDMWPDIRSRIDAAKVVALPSSREQGRRRRVRWLLPSVAVAAGVALFLPPVISRGRNTTTAPRDSISAFVPVADSLQTYEAEAAVLLNHLELERATLRPEAAATIDRDLKAIDAAIDELKIAIASDPRNAALRQLLASSYRQKVDLLKRAGNAS